MAKVRMRNLFTSLSLRLFLWFFFIIVVVFLSHAYLVSHQASQSWQDVLEQVAENTSEII